MRRRRMLIPLLLLVDVIFVSGCGAGRVPRSYLPVGASALYGDRTEDGVVVMLPRNAPSALEAVREALESTGYVVEHSATERLRLSTRAHPIGGDTTLVVRVEAIPVELPHPASSIVLTATYSVPSRRLHDAPVVQRAGEVNPLYGRLRAIAERLGNRREPAP